MGVPITFMDVFNPEQFEIIELACGSNGQSQSLLCKYPQKQKQIDKNGKVSDVGKLNDGTPCLVSDVMPKGTYYDIGDGKYRTRTYARILIRRIQKSKS